MLPQGNRRSLNHELLSVGDLFYDKVHYVVPRYQRGYAWTEEVERLLDDLWEAFYKSRKEEYLLGQIIVCPSEDPDRKLSEKYEQWDVIDGQQRCTTLYLILLAMFKILRDTRKEQDGFFSREVSELHVLITHNLGKTQWPKIKPASNGNLILEALVNDDLVMPQAEGPTPANLLDAWEEVREFLEQFPKSDLEDFMDFFQRKVVLIRLELEDAKHAVRVFQKVNNRGLVLDDADLVKNYLFEKVSSNDEFEKLSNYWDEAANNLYNSRLKKTKAMEFLLKLKIGITTGKSISTSAMYEEFKKALDSEDAVKNFARSLPIDSKTVKDISFNSVKQLGGYSDWSHFTGVRKAVQHYEVLLAAQHFTDSAYSRLNRLVQDRTILAGLSKTEKDFERLVHPWASNVAKLDPNAQIDEIREAATSAEVFSGLDELFETAFLKIQSLRYTTQSHQSTLRYLLARASKIIQDKIDANHRDLKSYMETTGKKKNSQLGFDLDHIFPKSKNQFGLHWKKSDAWNSLDQEQSELRENKLIHSIGNLILLHPKDNREQSDLLPWEKAKIQNYESSELYLNRIHSLDGDIRLNPQHLEIVDSLKLSKIPQLRTWNEESVEERARIIWALIRRDMEESFGLYL
jgi:uncharacterized protein with ParB-like and HNH nuclease domain